MKFPLPESIVAVAAIGAVLFQTGCAVSRGGTSSASHEPSDAQIEQYNSQVPAERQIVCRMETPVGSNIARRVCRELRDIEEAREFHQEQLQRIIR